jgi:hypothetical protein
MADRKSKRLSMRGRGYLSSAPELELFPTIEARDKAIREIEKSMMPSWRDGWGWLKFFLIVTVVMLAPYSLIIWISNAVSPLSQPWRGYLELVVAIVVYVEIIWFLLRRDIPRTLRQKLLEAGVPVCLDCGYGLRGLPAGTERCPECGKKLDDRVRALMSAAASARAD